MTDPTRAAREDVVSSFTVIKGAMIQETYSALGAWDLRLSKAENLDRMVERNEIAATSQNWLRDVRKVLNRRLDPMGRDIPLTVLARGGCAMDVWKPIMLWHITRDEFLLRDFLVHWLHTLRDSGALFVKTEELLEYLTNIGARGGTTEHAWSPQTLHRVAAGLLKIAVDFGLLAGRTTKQFRSYHLPESSFLYLLHAMSTELTNPGKLIDSPDWRLYYLAPSDVEQRILRLHQFRRLEYHAAGSLVQLTLPCGSAREYAERMVA